MERDYAKDYGPSLSARPDEDECAQMTFEECASLPFFLGGRGKGVNTGKGLG